MEQYRVFTLCLCVAWLLVAASSQQASGGVGDYNYCTVSGPCGKGQGDCDGNSECRAGLVCVQDQGAHYGNFPPPSANYDPSIVDVCEAPDPDLCRDWGPCPAGNGDCDSNSECQAGLTCVQDVGAKYGYPAYYDVCEAGGGSRPDPNYCRDHGPCSAGQGDCDPGQCASGLVCANDVGARYGLPAYYDVCEARSGGGSGQPGHADYCRDYGPCSAGQGDCDPGQCASGLVCANDVGAQYGLPAHYDVCEAQGGNDSGRGQPGHVDYCRDYGPCGVGQGDCDGNSECQSGLQCANDVGAQYGFPADYDVCQEADGGGGQDPCPTDDTPFCTNPSAGAAMRDGCIELDGPFGGFNVADYEWRNTCGRRVVIRAVCDDQVGDTSPHIETRDGFQTYTWRRGWGSSVGPYDTYSCVWCDRCADRGVGVTFQVCYDNDPNDGVSDPTPYSTGSGRYVCVN